jgi:flagellar protein FliO/FliZ
MQYSLSTLFPILATLAGVLALAVLAGRAARFSGLVKTGTGQRLALQDSLSLDRTRRLCIVRCDGRDVLLLLGSTDQDVVGWLPATEAQ